MSKRLFWNLAKYLLAFGLLGYVVWSNWDPNPGNEHSRGLKHVWEAHFVRGEPLHYHFLVLAGGIFAAGLVLTFVRWYLLVRAQDLPFTLPRALGLGAVGFFYNSLLPGSVGGDIVKAAAIAREQSRRTVAVATVLMDRAIALWALIWFVALSGLVFWWCGLLEGEAEARSLLIIKSAWGVVGVSLLGWVLLGMLPAYRAARFAGRLSRLPRVGGSAAEFWRAVWMYRMRPRSVAVAMLLSWVGQVGFVLTIYCGARAVCEPAAIPSLAEHFLLVPIGLIIQAAPLFPGGAGIGELGFGALYRLFRHPAANGVLASLVYRVLQWVLGVLGYLVYLWMKPALQPEPEPAAALVPAGAGAATGA